MTHRTCATDGCEREVLARDRCSRCYQRFRRTPDWQALKGADKFHRLTNVDTDTRMADCSQCGRVAARIRPGRTAECMTARIAGRTPEAIRRQALRQKYRLTPESVEAMRDAQAGACAICELVPDQLVIDHDHATGRVRGMLCHHCNVALGFMRDDPVRLTSAIQYLARQTAA